MIEKRGNTLPLMICDIIEALVLWPSIIKVQCPKWWTDYYFPSALFRETRNYSFLCPLLLASLGIPWRRFIPNCMFAPRTKQYWLRKTACLLHNCKRLVGVE